MILITSAAYIGPEFRSELGKIPPAFLPIGNRRLYTYQRDCLSKHDKVVLTIPESFTLPKHDFEQIKNMEIELLEIPEGLSLGDSIVCALNLSGYSEGPLTILHGDTLVYDIPEDLTDVIAVSEVEDNYEWATYDGKTVSPFHPYEGTHDDSKQVVNGFFRFSDARLFIQSMVRARGRFIEGVNLYGEQKPLTAHLTQDWYDFGHLHTYFRSKTHVSTARSFNKLNIEDGIVTKLSDMPNKMAAESAWFKNLPQTLRKFTPSYLGEIHEAGTVTGYQIEYQCISSLNELYVFGDLPVFVWEKILKACGDFVAICQQHRAESTPTGTFSDFLSNKTEARLEQFSSATGMSLETTWQLNGNTVPSLKDIHQASLNHVPKECHYSVSHGDFCFSNILYDFRSQSVKVIDPRGLDSDGELSMYGYAYYDIAKLAHSIIGKYDFIIAGYFDLTHEGDAIAFKLYETEHDIDIKERFESIITRRFGLTPPMVCAMQIQLFLSMLPLHADKPLRQKALMANAMKLYQDLETLT